MQTLTHHGVEQCWVRHLNKS